MNSSTGRGTATSEGTPGGSIPADFSLDKDVLQLEGVTVTGTATTIEKKNAATSVSTVSAEELRTTVCPRSM